MRPSEYLRNSCTAQWQAATDHIFCKELGLGTLNLEKMRIYLAQDYTFIDNFVRLSASAIHQAPTLSDRLPLAAFLGVIAGPENTYFQRAFNALNVKEPDRTKPHLLPATSDFQQLMLKAAQSGVYANMIAVLCVAEWVYLSWANQVKGSVEHLPFYFQEWITLHEGEYFESVVEHLRQQLDSAYQQSDEQQRAIIKDYFQQAVLLEKKFFDACYHV